MKAAKKIFTLEDAFSMLREINVKLDALLARSGLSEKDEIDEALDAHARGDVSKVFDILSKGGTQAKELILRSFIRGAEQRLRG